MNIEDYLNLFKENEIAIQITLDLEAQPTVHALVKRDVGERRDLVFAESDTLLGALEKMRVKTLG